MSSEPSGSNHYSKHLALNTATMGIQPSTHKPLVGGGINHAQTLTVIQEHYEFFLLI